MSSWVVANRTDLTVPEGTLLLLRDLVHEQTGTFFEDDRTDLMLDKLAPLARARECASLLDYYFLLKYEPEGKGEWERVMDALSVQETYFWREMDQIRALVDILVPAWFAKHTAPLRIWSAACATGEEPFTIAMVLQEAGWFDRAPIEIIGSDASGSALEKARRGVFRERSFRSLPAELKTKYFQSVPQGWCIDPKMLVRVRFHRANLVAPAEIAPFSTAPFIFCRNVFIYFSAEAIRRVLASFHKGMPAEGHLFVAAAESLLKLTSDFELREIGDAFAYVRKVES
jgi:chemotaxis protein methyltransferase CheR